MAVIVVNYRTPAVTVDCLRSLAEEIAVTPGVEVVVVDNGSGDDSVSRIEDGIKQNGWQAWATLVELDKNHGFSYANNRGAELFAGAEYVLLLNSDTIVHAGCLQHCVDVMNSQQAVGVMSCKVLNEDGSMQNVTRRFPNPARAIVGSLHLAWRFPRLFGWADLEDLGWDRESEQRDVDWLGGEFLFVRGSVYRELGGLDETFFFYGEDIEFCHRIKRAGYLRRYDPGATIVHLCARSSNNESADEFRSFHRWRARYLVQRKCYGRAASWGLRGVDLAAWSLRWAVRKFTARREPARTAECTSALRMVTRRLSL